MTTEEEITMKRLTDALQWICDELEKTQRELTAANERTEKAEKACAEMRDGMECAWGIIANAGGGDWTKESQVWQDAAIRWRDNNWKAVYNGTAGRDYISLEQHKSEVEKLHQQLNAESAIASKPQWVKCSEKMPTAGDEELPSKEEEKLCSLVAIIAVQPKR